MWKGEKAGYLAYHEWLRRHYTKTKCEECNSKTNLDWALKHGEKHGHDRKRYRVLCRKHHILYDKIKT